MRIKRKGLLGHAGPVLGLLLLPALAIAQPASPQEDLMRSTTALAEAEARSLDVPGVICSGDQLEIGINPAGSFGVGRVGQVGTGFRFPRSAADQAESLAWAFYGDGWTVSYKERNKDGEVVDKTAYWQPDWGYPPTPSQNFEPVHAKLLRDDDQACVYRATVRTLDKKLYLTFEFNFRKAYPSVILTTTLKAGHRARLFDVVFEKSADFDIHNDIDNYWSSNATAVFACGNNRSVGTPTVTLGISGHVPSGEENKWHRHHKYCKHAAGYGSSEDVIFADENAWDDYTRRGPGSAYKNRVPYLEDGFGSIHYFLGKLGRWDRKSVVTVYSAAFSQTAACTEDGAIPE